MSEFKEFQGKSLDQAIQAACDFFDLRREKLEIEIITGGSSGIFGLVGVKKAKVKARPRGGAMKNLNETRSVEEKLQDTAPVEKPAKAEPKKEQTEEKPAKEQKAEAPKNGVEEKKAPKKQAPRTADERPAAPKKPEQKKQEPKRKESRADDSRKEESPARDSRKEQPKQAPAKGKTPKGRKPAPKQHKNKPAREDAPRQQRQRSEERQAQPTERRMNDTEMTDLDQEKLLGVTKEVTSKLLEPIIGEAKLDITVDPDRVNVFIDDEEHSGLIIGREGQTLSALQYLSNRIVSRKMETSVRVQLDTGDYRERQDEKLRQIASHLAEKAVRSSRTQSTRPLSSYHRRVVHLALQEDNTVFTRSRGDGPMKRVLIVPKRKRRNTSKR
ncbi:MAG: Jag N-terminal domain-containing protein [Desulfovibrio sp.]